MADNYCESSSFITVPMEQLDDAYNILVRVQEELENDEFEGYVGFSAHIERQDDHHGVWIHDESVNPDHVETLVKALVEELKLPGIHVVSWAYTCSKPRIDEFGGGAFAVQMGEETVWVDAAREAERIASGGD